SCPSTSNNCSAGLAETSALTVSESWPVRRFPQPAASRPATPNGRLASFAVRWAARRGMSVTNSPLLRDRELLLHPKAHSKLSNPVPCWRLSQQVWGVINWKKVLFRFVMPAIPRPFSAQRAAMSTARRAVPAVRCGAVALLTGGQRVPPTRVAHALPRIRVILVPQTGHVPLAIRRPLVSDTSPEKSLFSRHLTQ